MAAAKPGLGFDLGIKTTAVVRRNLDLAEYLDLPISRKMYFRRVDGFADKLEAAMPSGMRQAMTDSSPKGSRWRFDPDGCIDEPVLVTA